MVAAPPAERVIDVALVSALLAEQAPDVADLPLTHFSSGWDNELFRLGDRLLVRLPRREAAAALIETELRWLPTLTISPNIDLPQPVFVGRPTEAYPWSWAIVNLIPGEPATCVPVAGRTRFAPVLADALWCLHVPAPGSAPLNPVRGLSLAQEPFQSRVRERAAGHPRAAELLARWDSWSHAPDFDGVDVWVHGDLHPHNLIVNPEGRLVGIVDWGDLTAGDPATDLATAWLTFDAEGRRLFVERTNEGELVDDATWTRSRAWALYLGLMLATHNDDEPLLSAVGHHALEQVLAEPVSA